tara:strand:- start:8 stop:487 length:480 start_codon:yes stop_codon:yes gene_type:complete
MSTGKEPYPFNGIKRITIFIMSALYIIIGVKHFLNPDFFVAIVPPFITWEKEAVLLSGLFEIILGVLLLFGKTRRLASWCIIMLLIAVFPANIYLYISEVPRETLNITQSQALFRMPFQITLIIIAIWHSKHWKSRQMAKMSLGMFFVTMTYFLMIWNN